MSEWNDEDVFRLMRETPRGRARPGFTERVMARIDRAPARGAHARPLALGLAGALLLGAAVGTALLRREASIPSDRGTAESTRERSERLDRIERLRAEYRALESEVRELRALAAENQPVIELGGTSEVDFVLDVGELATQTGLPAGPASHMERMR